MVEWWNFKKWDVALIFIIFRLTLSPQEVLWNSATQHSSSSNNRGDLPVSILEWQHKACILFLLFWKKSDLSSANKTLSTTAILHTSRIRSLFGRFRSVFAEFCTLTDVKPRLNGKLLIEYALCVALPGWKGVGVLIKNKNKWSIIEVIGPRSTHLLQK